MLSPSLYTNTMLKLSKTTSPNKLFDNDCITLYLGLFAWSPIDPAIMDKYSLQFMYF